MAVTVIDATARSGKRRGNEALLGHPVVAGSSTALSDERVAFTCECDRPGCSETVWMVEGHFRRVAQADGVALVAPGHAGPNDHVIASTASYLLVSRH
ncbi:MAG: hypothetical protein ACXVRI_09655 [Gaiellaceae bacterium]